MFDSLGSASQSTASPAANELASSSSNTLVNACFNTNQFIASDTIVVNKSRTSRHPLSISIPFLLQNRPKRIRKKKVVYDPSDSVGNKLILRKEYQSNHDDGDVFKEVAVKQTQLKRPCYRESSVDPRDRLDYSNVPKGWSFNVLDEYEPFTIEHEGIKLEYFLCKRCKGPGLYPKRTTIYEMKQHSVRCVSGNPELCCNKQAEGDENTTN